MDEENQLKELARAILWWQSPEETLGNPRRFLIQVMALATWQEFCQVKRIFGEAAFKDALVHAPPGVLDSRSWVYWRHFFGLPEATMPRRSLI